MVFSNSAIAGQWVNGKASSVAGERNYALWVPSGYAAEKRRSLPLVMMLHGCMQGPQDLSAISGMNAVADKNNFLVVYPEQTKEANPLRCWNWFDPRHQSRASGEPAILAAIIHEISKTYSIDNRSVYVAGISAGAAMAVVMGANYPDTFSAVGAMSGLAFKSATTVEGGMAAMKQGAPNPEQLGLLAFTAMRDGGVAAKVNRIPLITFHGDADPYLNPINAEQLIRQWAKVNDHLDDGKDNGSVKAEPMKTVEGTVPAGHTYTRSIYGDRFGNLLMEKWIIKGLGHAWSGSPSVSPFGDPKGPNASEEMWRFFVEATPAPPPPAPLQRKPSKPSIKGGRSE